MGAVWCHRNLQIALQEKPSGAHRQVIYDWVLKKSGSQDTASSAVKLTFLAHLRDFDVSKKGKWQPDPDHPNNHSFRWAFYYAIAKLLNWTERREVLVLGEGEGGDSDGFSHAFHEAANSLWPGAENDPPEPRRA
jgi:hypothetical protein